MKSSEELSLLDLEPDSELSLSIQPFLYRASNFLNITKQLEEIEDFEESENISKNNEIDIISEFK